MQLTQLFAGIIATASTVAAIDVYIHETGVPDVLNRRPSVLLVVFFVSEPELRFDLGLFLRVVVRELVLALLRTASRSASAPGAT